MIVVTGTAGFIGSNLVASLNENQFKDLVLVDDFSPMEKKQNWDKKNFTAKIDRNDFSKWIDSNHQYIQFIIHLGARTDTTEFDKKIFDELNLNYSKSIWIKCVEYGLPLIYASSAATYGSGESGYDDSHEILSKLKPLNPYGESKNEFDKWAIAQKKQPYFWAGLKFFNVYGPNEYHKGRMASVIYHAHLQIKQNGCMKLFRSHHSKFKDGEQMRDFVYVKDVCDVILFFLHHRKNSGIYNLGTGKARAFLDLANGTFNAMNVSSNIEFIDIPEDIREKYQYFTEANMNKLRSIGYDKAFTSLEDGINDYVKNYLSKGKWR